MQKLHTLVVARALVFSAALLIALALFTVSVALKSASPAVLAQTQADKSVASYPPDLTPYSRKAIAQDHIPLRTALPTISVVDVVVNNTNANLQNTDTFNDGETTIAINPANPNEIVITAFSGSWGSNAPQWHSTDGGSTWTKQFTIPNPPGFPLGCPCDQAVDYGRGNRLSGTFLANANSDGNAATNDVSIYSGTTTNPASSAAWNWLLLAGVTQLTNINSVSDRDVDQPWLLVNRDPVTAAQDNVYVAYDDFRGAPDMRVSVAAGSNPPNFTVDNRSGFSTGFVNPGHRLAVDPRNGAVYSLFQRRIAAGNGGSQNIDYMLNRSINAGAAWTLNGNVNGAIIANADSTQPQPKFGTVNALLGGVLHATVDPNNGDVYYVYGNRDSGTGNNRLALRRLTDNGAGGLNIGAQTFITGQVQAALPSIAISSNGVIGVQYYTFDGMSGGFPMFTVHLAVSMDQGVTFMDNVLETFLSSAADDGNTRQRVFGDYHQLKAVGNTLYGSFTGNGVPFGRTASNHDPIFVKAYVGNCSVTCSANIIASNSPNQCGATVNYPAPTTTGTCGTVTCTPASGSFFALGATPVNCVAADGPSCSFTVTVNDTQVPTIACANIAVNTAPGLCTQTVLYTPTVSDNCPGVAAAICNPPSGTVFPKGATPVNCTVKDAANNMAMCSFTVTVNDVEKPTIVCPANITVGTTDTTQTVSYPVPAVADNCPGVGVPACNPISGSAFPLGVTPVNCSVTDASGNVSNPCSFNITVNKVTVSFSDPLVCFGPGDVVVGTITITNNGNVNTNAVASVALPVGGLVLIPGSCAANLGACNLTPPSVVNYAGTLAPGQTATITYQTQIGDVASGTQLCATTTVNFDGGPLLNVLPCVKVTCPPLGPGAIYPSSSAVSDQKPGSVLFYPVYTSNAASAASQNARVSFTNTHPSRSAYLHLFFVDGSTCSVADSYLCLTPNQTAAILAADIDPGTTGYIVAVATDRNGCPISFNYLIGDEYVKFASGHAANLGAEAIAAIPGGLPACDANAATATLNFNNVSYNALPRVLAASSLVSRADGNDTLLIVNRVGGNLATGAATINGLFGLLYDDSEKAYSFQLPATACQVRGSLGNDLPRTVPRYDSIISAGRSGWLKLQGGTDVALFGAQINRNGNALTNSGAFNQGHNLHKLTLTTTASYTIPVFPPTC